MKAKRSICLSRHEHPSKSEAEYCSWLLARKQNREIVDYTTQFSIPFYVDGKLLRVWKADFKVIENDGSYSVHENKGRNLSDDNFRLKRDLFLILYPDIPLYVNKKLVNYKPTNNVKHYINKLKKAKSHGK